MQFGSDVVYMYSTYIVLTILSTAPNFFNGVW